MPESKTPDMERIRKRVLADYKNGGKPKELSEKYGVKVTTIKSWVRRAKESAKEKTEAENRRQAEAPKRRRGASAGNTNAVGNSGGAPVANVNALKHGGYSAVYFDTLTDEEKAFITEEKPDPETLLNEEIFLLTVRERRIMERIRKISAFDEKAPGGLGQVVAGVVQNEDKRKFDNEEDKVLFESIQRAKIESGNLLPGHKYSVSSRTEATYDVVHRLEEALTRVQAQKQRCVRALTELRTAQLAQSEIEDLDSVEAMIYGTDSGGEDVQKAPDDSV